MCIIVNINSVSGILMPDANANGIVGEDPFHLTLCVPFEMN